MTGRRIIAVGLVVSCAALSLLGAPATPSSGPMDRVAPRVTALFTPGDDCIKAIVEELNAARTSIRVQAYAFTSDAIAAALVAAKKRGVDVRVILDAGRVQGTGSEAENLLDNKVVVRVDGSHHYAHNKVVIIDSSAVITGSFNFSEQAQQQNAENLVIIRGHPEAVQRFSLNWAAHFNHSLPYTAADKSVAPKTTNGKEADEDTDVVYVTKHGKRYHRKDCQFARRGAQAITREEAIKSSKTPCQVCRPE